jgi:hypothetical protein
MYQFIFATVLFFSNPMEPLTYNPNFIPEINIDINAEKIYVAKEAIEIIKVWKDNTGYSVEINNENGVKYIIPGLNEIYVKENEKYKSETLIGKDYTIQDFSKYIIMIYRNLDQFPPFINNKLTFFYPELTPVFAIENGIIEKNEYDDSKGLCIIFNTLATPVVNIEYWNLKTTQVYNNKIVNVGDKIALVGMTGITIKPKLSLFFHSNNYFDDYKIIYINPK